MCTLVHTVFTPVTGARRTPQVIKLSIRDYTCVYVCVWNRRYQLLLPLNCVIILDTLSLDIILLRDNTTKRICFHGLSKKKFVPSFFQLPSQTFMETLLFFLRSYTPKRQLQASVRNVTYFLRKCTNNITKSLCYMFF